MKFKWLTALFGKDITSDGKITREEIEAAEIKGQQLEDENTQLRADLATAQSALAETSGQLDAQKQANTALQGSVASLTTENTELKAWKANHTQGKKGAAGSRDASDAGGEKKGFVADADYNQAAQEVYQKLHGKKEDEN